MHYIPIKRGAPRIPRQANEDMETFEGGELERRRPAPSLEELEVSVISLFEATLRVDVQTDERLIPDEVLSAWNPRTIVAVPMSCTDETVVLPDVGRDDRIAECRACEIEVEGQPGSHDVYQVAGGGNTRYALPHVVNALRRSRILPLDLVRPRHNELLEAHETNELRGEEVGTNTIDYFPVVAHRGLN